MGGWVDTVHNVKLKQRFLKPHLIAANLNVEKKNSLDSTRSLSYSSHCQIKRIQSINHVFQLNRIYICFNIIANIISVQLAQRTHRRCDILHVHYLYSLSFFSGVLVHC